MKRYQPHGFNLRDFKAVPDDNAPIYSWVWNAPVTKEETKRQIDDMAAQGIRSFYIIPEPKSFRPTRMITTLEPDFLTKEFFDEVRYAAEYGRSLGMTVWLYDEGGWPSGTACGKVMEGHQELGATELGSMQYSMKAGETVTGETKENGFRVLSIYVDGKREALPYTAKNDTEVTLYTVSRSWLPDLGNVDAVKRFVNLTYEQYLDTFGGDLTSYPCIFTDEPCIPWLPYIDPEYFTEQYGYNYIDYLPEILSDGESEKRIDYCDCFTRITGKVYFTILKEYCAEHGVLFTGHLNDDHDPASYKTQGGNLMRHLRYFDIPGIDVIWQQICWDGTSSDLLFPHFASSAASQTGGTYSLTESFAIYGGALSFAQMRYCLYFQAVRGVNLFNLMSSSYGNTGFDAMQARVSFRPEIPSGFARPDFNEFMGRLSYIASYGKPDVQCALYYPMRNIWKAGGSNPVADRFVALGSALDAAFTPYDVIDSDFLAEAQLETRDGKAVLTMKNAAYRVIFLPKGSILNDAEKNVIDRFKSLGGEVLENVTDRFAVARADANGLRMIKRIGENGTLYLVYNESAGRLCTKVAFDETGNAYELDLQKGCAYRAGSDAYLTLDCGEGCAFLFTDDVLETKEKIKPGEKLGDLSADTVRKTAEFRINEKGFRLDKVTEPAIAVSDGSFAAAFGEDFSGEAVYTVTLPKREKDCILDLGRVEQCCEVVLEGNSLGILSLPPYRYKIPAGDETVLTIKVGSTAGAAFAGFDPKTVFDDAHIGPYHEMAIVFERRDRCGGLYGPMTLWSLA